MLEIVCLIWLWRVNGKNAAANGQSPRKYRIMTTLWNTSTDSVKT